jgi:hypothetical protein
MAGTPLGLLTLKPPPMPRAFAPGGSQDWREIEVTATVPSNGLLIWIHGRTISPGCRSAEIKPMVTPPAVAGDLPHETTGQSAMWSGPSISPAGSHGQR